MKKRETQTKVEDLSMIIPIIFGSILEHKKRSEVADEYSEGPATLDIEEGQLRPAIEEIVFNLQNGQISGIVEAETGLYIVRLVEKFPPEVSPLSDVKDSITEIIFREKYRKRFMAWLADLKKDAYVEIKQ